MPEKNIPGSNLKPVLDARIDALSKAEGTVFSELGLASRELLIYVPVTNDIGMVNRLLKVLSPSNKRVAILYFREFLPWNWDDKAVMFTGKTHGETKQAKKMTAIDQWLSDETNNIWVWADRNVEVKQRNANYFNQIGNLVERALTDNGKNSDGTERKIGAKDVFYAVIQGGVSLDDMLAIAAEAEQVRDAEEAAANDGKVIEGEATEVVEPPAITANENETEGETADKTATA